MSIHSGRRLPQPYNIICLGPGRASSGGQADETPGGTAILAY